MDAPTFDNLIDGYFEDRLSEQELAELNQALRSSPQARQRFWEHGHLQSYLVELAERKQGEDASHRLASQDALEILRQLEELAEPDLREVVPEPRPIVLRPPNAAQRGWIRFTAAVNTAGPITRGLATAAAAAIVLLLGWQLLVQSPDNNDTAPPVVQNNPGVTAPIPTAHARLARSFDARWQGPAIRDNQLIDRSRPYTLTHGAIDLTLDSGATVALRAPVTFQIAEDNRLTLTRGQAYAVVPEAAIGFEIDTPEGRVVDLGTEFGVLVDEVGRGEVVVFKGLVEAVSDDQPDNPVKIPENWGSSLKKGAPVAAALRPIAAFETTRYIRDWNEVIYHPECFKGVYHKTTPERLVDNAVEADHIQVFPEARGVVLEQPLEVIRLYEDSTTYLAGNVPTRTIKPGTSVNTFLVYFDLPGTGNHDTTRQVELTFPGEVLGVVSSQKDLIATDNLLGAPGTRYPPPGEQTYRGSLDPPNTPKSDTVRLEQDRRTVTVHMTTRGVDSVRILVRNTDSERPDR